MPTEKWTDMSSRLGDAVGNLPVHLGFTLRLLQALGGGSQLHAEVPHHVDVPVERRVIALVDLVGTYFLGCPAQQLGRLPELALDAPEVLDGRLLLVGALALNWLCLHSKAKLLNLLNGVLGLLLRHSLQQHRHSGLQGLIVGSLHALDGDTGDAVGNGRCQQPHHVLGLVLCPKPVVSAPNEHSPWRRPEKACGVAAKKSKAC
mmetsp:Transcript_41943/g.99924  ORF Transcript_41943/g.99924 Transcript_41943/m.99924 type:complete len:204 (+) Transcript_41943:136-747(+)